MIRPPRQGSGSSKGVLENFPALGSFCPGFSETYPVHTFKRGKGARLYDLDGNRFLDFDLENGSLLFGHAPPFVTHAIKNALSLGNLSSSVNREITRFYSVLKHRFPEITGYTAHFLPEAAAAAALLRSAYPDGNPLFRTDTWIVMTLPFWKEKLQPLPAEGEAPSFWTKQNPPSATARSCSQGCSNRKPQR